MYNSKEKQKKAWQRWYKKNKAKAISAAAKRNKTKREENRNWIRELKSNLSCVRCGFDNPAALHFHHKDPKQKDITVGNASSSGWSRKKIELEISKCEVLCANCHAIEHSNQGVTQSG